MNKTIKYGSIDIGSNAIRLLISTAHQSEKGVFFKKNSLIRVPIRLGQDVFTKGKIGAKNQKRMVQAMIAYRNLMDAHDVQDYLACATSAMRDASNSKQLLKEIKEKANIDIEIISGSKEAEIIFQTHIEKLLNDKKAYLYIDVGGGSTELSLFNGKTLMASKSFNIGTIRLLNDLVDKKEWDLMKQWIQKNTKNLKQINAIASGGNINRVYKLIGKKKLEPILIEEVNEVKENIERTPVNLRQELFNMNPDRADVILPALSIYLSVFRWANSSEIYVPKVGLSDGLVRKLHETKKS
ncbi:MAG: exopolyphosphatase [Flavobacteriales bacterium]